MIRIGVCLAIMLGLAFAISPATIAGGAETESQKACLGQAETREEAVAVYTLFYYGNPPQYGAWLRCQHHGKFYLSTLRNGGAEDLKNLKANDKIFVCSFDFSPKKHRTPNGHYAADDKGKQ